MPPLRHRKSRNQTFKTIFVIICGLIIFASIIAPPAVADTSNRSNQEVVTLTISIVNQTATPVNGARIEASWKNGSTTQKTSNNGKAFVDVPAGADVTINISHSTYMRNLPYQIKNASEAEITIHVSKKGSIQVNTFEDGDALADTRILLWKSSTVIARGKTNSQGIFQSRTIEQGEYTLVAFKQGYYRKKQTVEINGSSSRNLHLEQGSVIYTVKVVDPYFDPPKPVINANVKIGGVGEVTTRSQGETRLSVPINSLLQFQVSKEGYQAVTRRLNTQESNGTVRFEISRTPHLNLSLLSDNILMEERVLLTVTNEYGEPVQNATIQANGSQVGQTDTDGELVVKFDEPGTYQLQAETKKIDSDPITLHVVSRSTATETSTPTATRTSTPTPTETSTPATTTGNSSGVQTPGFTVYMALIALFLYALVSHRS